MIWGSDFPGNVLPGNGIEPSIPFPKIISRILRFQENHFPKWPVSRKAISLNVLFPGKTTPGKGKIYIFIFGAPIFSTWAVLPCYGWSAYRYFLENILIEHFAFFKFWDMIHFVKFISMKRVIPGNDFPEKGYSKKWLSRERDIPGIFSGKCFSGKYLQ